MEIFGKSSRKRIAAVNCFVAIEKCVLKTFAFVDLSTFYSYTNGYFVHFYAVSARIFSTFVKNISLF